MSGMKDLLGDTPAIYSAPSPRTSSLPDHIPDEIVARFEQFSLEAARKVRRYSADAILHRIRWYEQIERGCDTFKVNNNYSSALARWFMARHPHLDGFFETRELKS